MDKNNIVKLAIDTYRGNLDGNFSKNEGHKALIKALIDANGGKTQVDIKSIRRNRAEIFDILEVIIPAFVKEGLMGDEFYTRFVDERRLDVGDKNEFVIEPNTYLTVSKVANGVATPRRQRFGERSTFSLETSPRAIRVYEELNRLLAGRVDWNQFIDTAVRAFKQNLYNDIFVAFNGISSSTQGMNATYYPAAGTYDESSLLGLIDLVEQANDAPAVLLGTKAALRNITTAVVSEKAREDLYNTGLYGRFFGTPILSVSNRKRIGADQGILSDKKIYVVSADDKFIKVAFEGDALMSERDPMNNADLSQEFLYLESYGVGVCIAAKMAVLELS